MTEDERPALELEFEPGSGLVPAIVQDARSGRVLMLGYMNRAAVARSRETGRVTFYSRSRERLWTKGETSGNWLELIELRPDCDRDALLVRAIPHGPTCHTGAPSCFEEPAAPGLGEVLAELARTIDERRKGRPEGSYTVELLDAGPVTVAQKIAEEAVELALELATGGDRTAEEAADLLYHLLVGLTSTGTSPKDVATVLRTRAQG